MKKQICKNCTHYNAFYSKRNDCFINSQHGRCNISYRILKNDESCERWIDNYKKCIERKRVYLETLNEMVNNINEIIQILREDGQAEQGG